MTAPAISVVMAVHNGEPYVRAAVESVLGQTFGNFEFVVIDDCSTDATPEIVLGYADSRVVYRRNATNIGQTRSLNAGIELARAPLIARIDADDLFYPAKLERQVAHLERRPDVAVLGTAAHVINQDDRRTGLVVSPSDPKEIMFRLCRGVPVIHITVIMRADALRAVGLYDPTYRYSQDYGLWSEFARAGYRIDNLSEPLAAFRERDDSVNALNKFGDASAETSRITQRNTRDFVALDLSLDECRSIDLLMFPAARLSIDEMVGAYRNLRAIAARVWREGVPPRVRLSLAARLFWAVSKYLDHSAGDGRRAESRRAVIAAARSHRRDAVIAGTLLSANAISGIGFDRITRIKAAATRYLVR